MDIDELRTVQSKERRKDSLQHLRDSFYDDVAAYIADRRDARDERAAAVDKPFSDPEVRRLSDEIDTAEEVAESLYERRVGKVVKLASFAAADAPVDTEGMTSQELDLFEGLVARIRGNKESVLNVLADGPGAAADGADGGAGAEPTSEAGSGPETTPDANADAESEPGAADGAAGPAVDAVTGADGPDRTGAEAGADANADGDGGGGGGGDLLADAMGGDPGADDATGGAPPAGDEGTADPGEAPTGEPRDRPTPPDEDDPAGGADGTGGDPVDARNADPAPTRAEDPPAAAAGAGDDGADAGTVADTGPDDDRTTVRITSDVGSILGVDEREYDLESEDVVSLPAANADPLVARDAAEPLE